MGKEEKKAETNPMKPCQFRYFTMMDPRSGAGSLQFIPCPKTSKANVILNTSGCAMWHEKLGGCKIEIAIDMLVSQAEGNQIVRPG